MQNTHGFLNMIKCGSIPGVRPGARHECSHIDHRWRDETSGSDLSMIEEVVEALLKIDDCCPCILRGNDVEQLLQRSILE